MRNNDNYPDFLVGVCCMTYNHHAYIEDAMNGFTMQQTTFPFVCVIIDDASTDGEPDVILRYMNDHFDLSPESGARQWETDEARFLYARHRQNPNCYFGIVLLKTNYYSQHKSKKHLMTQWLSDVKYYALCEGDDYWTDPNKLQIQVDFLENHPDYSMCWHRAVYVSAIDGEEKGDYRGYTKSMTCKTEDMIEKGGEFCPTASILYRRKLLTEAPKELFDQYVGDYPLQLYLSFTGKVYYFDRRMSVYRIDVPGSWLQRTHKDKDYRLVRNKLWFYEKKLLDDFNRFSYYKYNKSFQQRENFYLFRAFWATKEYSIARHYWYKMNFFKRPWGIRRLLYLHGYSVIKARFDLYKIIKNFFVVKK